MKYILGFLPSPYHTRAPTDIGRSQLNITPAFDEAPASKYTCSELLEVFSHPTAQDTFPSPQPLRNAVRQAHRPNQLSSPPAGSRSPTRTLPCLQTALIGATRHRIPCNNTRSTGTALWHGGMMVPFCLCCTVGPGLTRWRRRGEFGA